jgi:protein required for attachment to host cells
MRMGEGYGARQARVQAGRGNQRRLFGVGGRRKEIAMQVPHNSFVLVADGQKMLFFRNEGDGEYPNLEVDTKTVQDNPYDRDQKTDGPGRAANAVRPGASTMEEVDFHQQEEDRFAADAADMLKQRALQNNLDSLIVVAPPRTLGELRKHYHKEVEKRLIGEIAKDLTGHPVDEIERIIAAS